MTNKEKTTENKVIWKLKLGDSAYNIIPEANTVIRVSSHFPMPRQLVSKPPTSDYDNIFWVLVRDFINPKYSELDVELYEASNLIDSGNVERGNAIIRTRIGFIEKDSGKKIAYSIIGAKEGEITAKVKSVKRMILTRGFPAKY